MLKYINTKIRLLRTGLFFSFLALAVPSLSNLNAQEGSENEKQSPPTPHYVGIPGAYGVAGCGVGSMVFGRRGNQVFAATTNGLYWNQSSGISSGTLNCDAEIPDQASQLQKSRTVFVSVNYSLLEVEMASGQGQRLESFAGLLGCPMDTAFTDMTQKSHSYFFEVPPSKAHKFVQRVQRKIRSNAVLSKHCKMQA